MPELHDLLERRASGYGPPADLFERVLDRRRRRDRNRRIGDGLVGLVVAGVVLGGLVWVIGSEPTPADDRSPYLGRWFTTDLDGSTPTMTVRTAGERAVEIVVHDDAASVCSGAPSTMTGTGGLDDAGDLVIPSPVLTCDDGSEPEALSGPPLHEQLRDLTFVLDAETETLTDNLGGVWLRERSGEPPAPGGMWPQTTMEEVRQAQERADAGDPDYTWQLGPRPSPPEPTPEHVELELVDRFIREVLGWEAYRFNPFEGGHPAGNGDGFEDGDLTNQRYVRCAPGRTNPLYPHQPDSREASESCAPTIDDFRYESVSLDLAQPDRHGSDGIWVVSRWELTAPFVQVDPAPVEARVTESLEEFLAARIAGNGAERFVQLYLDSMTVPLLYATTSGAPHERYEIEGVDGPWWPYGGGTFRVRVFADGDATVVEQEIRWFQDGGVSLDAYSTTENGRPIVLSHTSSDGEVTLSAPSTWAMWWPEAAHVADVGVWFGIMQQVAEPSFEGGETIGFVDPVAYDAWCAANGGSPLLSAPADADAIAQQVIADPDFEATAPVAARIGGLEAVSIDVALAPGGKACGIGMIEISRWIHEAWEPGLRLRLYLVDLPQGMSVETLAITVVAPKERFDDVVAETAPIIDSIEFHPR